MISIRINNQVTQVSKHLLLSWPDCTEGAGEKERGGDTAEEQGALPGPAAQSGEDWPEQQQVEQAQQHLQ